MAVREDVRERGFSILRDVFHAREVRDLVDAVEQVHDDHAIRSRGGVYAVRNLLHVSPAIAGLARGDKLRSIVDRALGGESFPVRGTLFDKTAAANWLVPWHQDLTICVAARLDVPGYGPWTTKAGVCHVQPPSAVLEGMLSVRVHLDDCDESNGVLRVLPGSHRLGRMTAQQIAEHQRSGAPVSCVVPRGGVVLMKPLLLHASSAASQPGHRRVIHIDYASTQLDGGLQWWIDV